ncbi:MAG: hypothetical protein KTR31_40605 [Myxococcales bacterium]|nr:hypothetical protein [Myxococcales bacterium]
MSESLDVREDLHGIDVVLPVTRDRSLRILATALVAAAVGVWVLSEPSGSSLLLVAAVAVVVRAFRDQRHATLRIDHGHVEIGRMELARFVVHRLPLLGMEVLKREDRLQLDADGQRVVLRGLSPEHLAWVAERITEAAAAAQPLTAQPEPPEALQRLRGKRADQVPEQP